jgi:hypothetical protein
MLPQLFSVQVLSLVVAAVAVFFGPLIQLFIAKVQIRAAILSANRQRWIDQLREQIAQFLVLASDLKTNAVFRIYDAETTFKKNLEMQLRRSTIQLLLNPNEKDHKRLVELIGSATANISTPPDKDTTDLTIIVSLSQAVLKREWERVKAAK